MTRFAKTLRMLFSASALTALLVTPMIVASVVNAGPRTTIEAPVQAKQGLGLVLLVSLQRA